MPEMIDHYRIDHLLGQGGMGVVYQATDMNLQRPVAIKVMHPHLASDQGFQQRFLQEARAAASLDHPNIVRVLYFGMQGDQLYLVEDLITGGSLREYLQHLHLQRTALDLNEVVEFGRQIADALQYAHQRGMIHRDVKPDNVLLKPVVRDNATTFEAMLTDFGLAKLSEGMVQSVPGQTMGTFPYMSPEQCRGEEIDARSDIYSLGVMLYELATGRLPFLANSLTEAIRLHTTAPVPDPNSVRPGLPIPLVDIITRALAKNPNDRFATAGEMAQTLQRLGQALENQPTVPEMPGSAVDSLATYLMSQPGSMRQSTMTVQQRGPAAQASQAGVDRLTILSDAGVTQTIPLTKDEMIIGRNPSSDVVLSSEKVSRTHARINRRREDGMITITDLGSANGTWLNNERLAPNVPSTWASGQSVQVGDFRITLQLVGAQAVKKTSEVAARAPSTGRTQAPPQPGAAKVGAVLLPNVLDVKPGGQAELTVEVTNLGDRADSFFIQLPNVPREWATYPAEPLQLFPGDKGNFRVRFHPPAAGASAGQFGFQVRVGTGGQGDVTVNGTLHVTASSSFTFDMQPRRLSRSGDAVLIVTNTGNAQDNYTVYAQDTNNSLVFNVGQAKFSLGPGQVGQIPIQVLPLRRPLIGGTSMVPFEVTIQAASLPDRMQSQSGEFLLSSSVPTLALGIIPVACVGMLLVMLVVLALASGQNSADAVAQTARAASGTAIANQTQIALAGTLGLSPTASPTTSTFPTLTSPPFFFTEVPQPTSVFFALNQTQTAQAMSFIAAASQTAQAQTSVAINNQQVIAAATATAQAAIQIALLQTVTAQVIQLTQGAGNQAATGQAGAQQAALQTATALAIQVATAQQAINLTATAQSAIQAALNQTSTAQAIQIQQSAATQTAAAVAAAAQAQQTQVAQQTAAVAAQQTQIAGQTAAAGAALTAAANAQKTQAAGAAQTAAAAQLTLVAGQTAAAGNAQQTAIAGQTAVAAANAQQTAIAGQTAAAGNAQQTAIAGQTAAAGNAQQTAIAGQTAAAGNAQQTAIAGQTAVAAANAQQTQIAAQTATAAAAANNQPQFIHVADPATINNNVTTLTNGAVNGNAAALLFVTSNYSPKNVVNPNEVGVGRSGPAWVVLTENQAPMPANTAFNIDAQNPSQTVFIHQANTGNTAGHVTDISSPATDNQPNAILIVTQNFTAGNTLNPHPIGVVYDAGKNKWTIFNEDNAPMPANATFNVQVMNAGPNAFGVQAGGANINGNKVLIDNPALNGHPQALIVVTQHGAGNVANPHVIGVAYDPGTNKWVIYNQDNAPMPAGASFFVKII